MAMKQGLKVRGPRSGFSKNEKKKKGPRSKAHNFNSWRKGPGPRSAKLGRTWGPHSMKKKYKNSPEKSHSPKKKKILTSQKKIKKPAKFPCTIPMYIPMALNSFQFLQLLVFFFFLFEFLFSFYVQAIKHKAMWQALKPSGSHSTLLDSLVVLTMEAKSGWLQRFWGVLEFFKFRTLTHTTFLSSLLLK